MFIQLTLTQPGSWGPHTVDYFGEKYPIGGRAPVILRTADIRSAHPARDCTIIMLLSKQQYAVAESPEAVMQAIAASLPQERSISDHAIMASVHGHVESRINVQSQVNHALLLPDGNPS